jgi:hypothetical protein
MLQEFALRCNATDAVDAVKSSAGRPGEVDINATYIVLGI